MRVWTILLSIISVVTFSFAAEKSSTGPATQPGGDTYKVKKGTLKLEVSTDGTLAALEPFEVKLKTKAYAGALTVQSAAAHGAMVRKGESILELDAKPFIWAVEGAENELATARANLKKSEADAELATRSEALSLRIAALRPKLKGHLERDLYRGRAALGIERARQTARRHGEQLSS